jgi:hypothetical protein
MKTQPRRAAADAADTPATSPSTLFAIDQRVSFVNPVTRQRESLPLLTALTAACEYLRVGTPFELVDLDDELLVRFDGTQLEARPPLAEVLYATTQVLSSIVQKSLSEAFTYLVGEEQARRVLTQMQAPRSAESSAEQSEQPEQPEQPEHLGVFDSGKS